MAPPKRAHNLPNRKQKKTPCQSDLGLPYKSQGLNPGAVAAKPIAHSNSLQEAPWHARSLNRALKCRLSSAKT
jgi:hypothetical protein